MGEVSDLHPFIPCKVPLGGWSDRLVEPHQRFSPEAACVMAHAKLSAFVAEKHAQTVRRMYVCVCVREGEGCFLLPACCCWLLAVLWAGGGAGPRKQQRDMCPLFTFSRQHTPLQTQQNKQNGTWVPPWAAGRWDVRAKGPFQPQLAILIDLTNSSRYYSGLEVPQGVSYIKVRGPGKFRV